jgi:excisionase family DNA binding protein
MAEVAEVPRKLYRVPEVARSLGLSQSQTYELIAEGQIKSVTVGRSRRVTAGAIDAFVRAREKAQAT